MNIKLFFSVVFLVVVQATVKAATFTSIKSGDWNDPETWNTSGSTVPSNTDNVKIGTAHTITITANAACASIELDSNSGYLNVNSGIILTIFGRIYVNSSNSSIRELYLLGMGTINCVSIDVGDSSSPNTSSPPTKIYSTITNLNITGDLSLYSSVYASNQTNNATFSHEAGTVKIGGQIKTTNTAPSVSTLTMPTFSTPITFNPGTGAITYPAASYDKTLVLSYANPVAISSGAVVNLSGLKATVNYNATNQTVYTTTYNNLTLSGSGAKTFGATTIVNNNLTIASGVVANLGAGLNHTAKLLTLGNTIKNRGTWGTTASSAANKNDVFFSNTGIVTVSEECTGETKTWDGTAWSGVTKPTINDHVDFNGNYDSGKDGGSVEACSCHIADQTNAKVVFKSGHTFTVANRLDVNTANFGIGSNGVLTFEDGASLVQLNDESNTGVITYTRNSEPMKYLDYTYWSSPIKDQNARALSPDTFKDDAQGYRGYKVDNGAWKAITDTEIMQPGVGYIIQAPRQVTFPYTEIADFKGVPNNGPVAVPLSVWNWNLIGNPYPSAISADDFILANQNDILGTLSFWTHNTPPAHIDDPANPDYNSQYYYNYTADDYAMYSLVGGTETNPTLPGEGLPAESDVDNKVPSGFIAAGQSFIVCSVEDYTVDGGDGYANFTNDMRVVGNNTQFFKFRKSTALEKHRVWLNLTNSQGLFKQILIGYVEGATNSHDNLYDGFVYNGNVYANFYSINEATDYTIQGRELPFSKDDLVPLGFSLNLGNKPNVVRTFKIGIDHVDGDLANQPIYLEDKIEKKVWDLRKGDYVFTSLDGVYNDRFVLKYTNTSLGIDKIESDVNKLTVLVKNKIITIDSKADNIKKVVVFDISGKIIFKSDKVNNSVLEISNLKSANQVIIVKVILESGKIQTTKVVFK
ncbi:T9SS sorting signal type C domain-containing protein [Flavobacterium agrisoli]|uniref:T9SS type A sorting domain-containing protein n=1 Tax=Flavobacterium agrisoli TaxID=2793066 RepID=A0A934PM41_9FLAO|nr:T9SS sorting signal type C domain-containing protein [Flavobacterium agrisoli]MBK0369819.1 T9SS type A sorting domain-containing protein [Flavobacterium agrisoli]